jgi:hypothetical protein
MPSRISESLIQRALAPIDLSSVYQRIESLNNQMIAQDRYRRQQATKEYQTDLATIGKDVRGVRDVDKTKAIQLYNNWSEAGKQLANNPNLINSNYKAYRELKDKHTELETQLETHIAGSKSQKEMEKKLAIDLMDPTKVDDFEDGAYGTFKKNVLDNTWDVIDKNNLNNPSIYASKIIDGGKFHAGLPSAIKNTYTDKMVEDASYKGAPGVKKFTVVKNVPSDYASVKEAVNNQLYVVGDKKAPKYANQEFKRVFDSQDYYNTYQQVVDFNRDDNPEGHKKFGVPKIPLTEFDDNLPPMAKYVNYVAAKEFVNKYKAPEVKEEIKVFDQPTYDAYKRKQAEASSMGLIRYRKSLDDKGKEVEVADLTPAFDKISVGGQKGLEAMKRFSTTFNEMPIIGATVHPIIANQKYAEQESGTFSAGNNIAKSIVGKDFEIGSATPEQRERKLQEFADKINEHNRKKGFPNTDVTPSAINQGKAFVLYTDPENYIVVDPTQSASRAYINKKIKTSELSAKEGRSAISKDVKASGKGFGYMGIDEDGNPIFN